MRIEIYFVILQFEDVTHSPNFKSNTIMIIEHNVDLIKTADYIIDLGPRGGDEGGEIIAQGTPEEVAKIKQSYTGMYLKKIL